MSMPMATGRLHRPGVFATATGACTGLAVRLALRSVRLQRITTVLRWCVHTTRRPATSQEVLRALAAVDAGARWVPVRIACLERSVAAFLLLAARRRAVTWHLGVRTPPLASHAWLADQSGAPLGEQTSTAGYRPLLTISATTPTGEVRD